MEAGGGAWEWERVVEGGGPQSVERESGRPQSGKWGVEGSWARALEDRGLDVVEVGS